MKLELCAWVADDDEGNYYRAIWYLASALLLVGAGPRALSALQNTFEQVLAERVNTRP